MSLCDAENGADVTGGRRNLRFLSVVGAAASLAAFVFSCGTPPKTESIAPSQAACQIVPLPVPMPETLTVALPDAIDPTRAPHPSNGTERILYGHLYETLIALDCLGDVIPGLAESWSSRDGGRRWVFTLREGATFWDDSPVTARRVADSWGNDVTSRAARAAGVHETVVEGDRELVIYLDPARSDVPRFLADPPFAVALHGSASRWPLGTGPYRPHSEGPAGPASSSGALAVRPVQSGERPFIRFRVATGTETDARDLLEDGVDVLVTADPAVLDYAAARSQFDDIPLPWNHTYLLLSTTRARELRGGRRVSPLSDRVVDELARDAVRGDARGHRPPAWWDDLGACIDPYRLLAGLPPIASGADSEDLRRIVFHQRDPTARDLAGRIAALAATDPHSSPEAASLATAVPGLQGEDVPRDGGAPRTGGLDDERFTVSLREGSDFAYVLPVQAHVADPCLEIMRLVSEVEWSAQVGTGLSSLPLPLVDTRAHVIVRAKHAGLTVDWSGTVRVTRGTAGVR